MYIKIKYVATVKLYCYNLYINLIFLSFIRRIGGMADATDSKSVGSNTVWVQVPYPAPIINKKMSYLAHLFIYSNIYQSINKIL